MKNYFNILLLVLAANLLFAQTPQQLKYALVQSRDYSFKLGSKTDSSRYLATAFDKTKGLYPIIKQNAVGGSNAVYFEENQSINVCVFQGNIPQNFSLTELKTFFNSRKKMKGALPSTYHERKDIFLENTPLGMDVLKHGAFSYYSAVFKGANVTIFTQAIITYITDPVAQKQVYFDFSASDTKPKKDCYNWQTTDKQAYLYFQGDMAFNDETGYNVPALTNISFDTGKPLKTAASNLVSGSQNPSMQSKFYLDFFKMFSGNTKPSPSETYYIYYTIRNMANKTFAIKVKFAGCENTKGKFSVDIIYPTDSSGNPTTQKQPEGTILNLNPQP